MRRPYMTAHFGGLWNLTCLSYGTYLDEGQASNQPDLDEGYGRHLPITEGVGFAQAIRAQKTLFTHIGHIQLAPEELQTYLPDDTFDIAYDDQVVELLA